MRPLQYLKNTFIFLPIFFGLRITDPTDLYRTILAFCAFSLTASAVYILNDYLDVDEDRLHPKKRTRPLASGAIQTHTALVLMMVVLTAGLALGYYLGIIPLLILYVCLNLLYCLYLKKIAIVDIVVIAIGFVIRLFVGSAVTGIALSMWIVLLTFLIALFLALAKRRDDVLIVMKGGAKPRESIDGYTLDFLNVAMAIMGTIVIVAYLMYTASPEVVNRFHSPYLYLTSLFVIVGILRYLQIVLVFQDSGSPTKILAYDRFIQTCIGLWIISISYLIYHI